MLKSSTLSPLNTDQTFNGRWKKSQHTQFLLGLQLYGRDWKKISALVGTRTGSQIRSHAQKYFMKLGKQGQTDKNSSEEAVNKKPLTVISNSENQGGKEMSFFINLIADIPQQIVQNEFWSHFIESNQRQQKNVTSACEQDKRSSFVALELVYDTKIESSCSIASNVCASNI